MAKAQRFLNVDFEPKLRQVEQDFMRLSRSFENKEQAMGAALVAAQRDIEGMFEDEQDAFGEKWEYWKTWPAEGHSKSYADIAEELPNIGIMNREGLPTGLRATASQASQFRIIGNRLTYGYDLPEWAGPHLEGGYMVSDDYMLPQRSWYPYSAYGVQEVHRIFDAWAEHNISIMQRTSKRGRTYTQIQTRIPTGRGAETRFGPSL